MRNRYQEKIEVAERAVEFQAEALQSGIDAARRAVLLLESGDLETELKVQLLAGLLQAAAILASSDEVSRELQ